MGQGRKKGATVPRRAVLPAKDGRGSKTVAERPYCEQTHPVAFNARSSSAPQIRLAVRVVIGNPPALVAQRGESIGHVASRDEVAVRGCLELGYELAGEIIQFDAATSEGVALISGKKDIQETR